MRVVKVLLRDNSIYYLFVEGPNHKIILNAEDDRWNAELENQLLDAGNKQLQLIQHMRKPDYLYMNVINGVL